MVVFCCVGRATVRVCSIFMILAVTGSFINCEAWDHGPSWSQGTNYPTPVPIAASYSPLTVSPERKPVKPYLAALSPVVCPENNYLIKLAYGRTFGTCTQLDYATLEMSRSVRKFPTTTIFGPALGEVQVALLGSYVIYREGQIEKIKRLRFDDGFELGWVPKGRFTFMTSKGGFLPYVESGAGIGYVSETFRNSGSRFNWSLMAGFGLQKHNPAASLSIGVQWRHLSNGNMWGEGDELHNSNSGTDMIQGLASIKKRF